VSRVPMVGFQDGGDHVRRGDLGGPPCHLYNERGVYSQMVDKKVDSTEERKYVNTAPATKKIRTYSLRRTWFTSTERRAYKFIVGLVVARR